MAALALRGIGLQALRMVARNLEDRKMMKHAPKRPSSELKFVHEVLSCLIDVVYALDKGKTPEICAQSVGYKLLDAADLNVGTPAEVANGKHLSTLRWLVFGRVGLGPNGGSGRLRAEDDEKSGEAKYRGVDQWPQYVVAIRGTVLTRPEDIIDDLSVGLEILGTQPMMFEPLMHQLSELHKKAPGPDGVWVTGHSLGATVGLIATLRLVEVENIVLTTHFFNPPHISVDVLAKKLFIGTANGLGAGVGKIPFIGCLLKEAIRGTGRGTGSRITKVMGRTARKVGKALAPTIYEKGAQSQQTLRMAKYCPNLYVNVNDPVSNEYIGHFQRGSPAVSVSVLLRSKVRKILPIGSDCAWESFHLIPQAYLHTNHWAKGPYHAHKLKQWYLYDPVNLTSKLVGSSLR